MKIYHDGKEMTTVEEELKELAEIKQRAEDKYNNMIHYISHTDDLMERQAARMIMFAVGEILGYDDKEIDKDIKEAYGVE